MQSFDTEAADIVTSNMGLFGSTAQPMVNGKDEVIFALQEFVFAAGIDCTLLTSALCEGDESGMDVSTSSPAFDLSSPPSPSPTLLSMCQSAPDGGLPIKMGDISQTLLGGAYTPMSNVDHM